MSLALTPIVAGAQVGPDGVDPASESEIRRHNTETRRALYFDRLDHHLNEEEMTNGDVISIAQKRTIRGSSLDLVTNVRGPP